MEATRKCIICDDEYHGNSWGVEINQGREVEWEKKKLICFYCCRHTVNYLNILINEEACPCFYGGSCPTNGKHK